MTVTTELDADFVHDTHGWYQRLRAEAPVHPVLFEEGVRAWLVTRYADALALHPRLIKDASRTLAEFPPERPALPGFGFREHVDVGPAGAHSVTPTRRQGVHRTNRRADATPDRRNRKRTARHHRSR